MNRRDFLKAIDDKEPLFTSGEFPYLPVEPEFNSEDFGVVVLDTAIPEADEAPDEP